ncbi:hypothetical protein, partial [Acinetobacter baumannii]|uniref:hypothetical protein n=1 Tax=Acinetobacter baumannii TaxID=470 RepID=UPI00396C522E
IHSLFSFKIHALRYRATKNLTNDKNKHLHAFRCTACANFGFFSGRFIKNGTLLAFYDLETYKTQGNYRWKLQLLVQVWRV